MDKIFKLLGASNHCPDEREKNDYYATDPALVDDLLYYEQFDEYIWECACGGGHISEALKRRYGKTVFSTDLIHRGYEGQQPGSIDFLQRKSPWHGDIITNPPYGKFGQLFVEKAMELLTEEHKCAFLLKLLFLETQGRKKMFKKFPPKTIYVYSTRQSCWKNGKPMEGSSAVCYAWYIWVKGFTGDPIIKWI